MAGKAPLLLASVLFAVGAVGLLLTSAERAEWGPFEAQRQAPPAPSEVLVYNANLQFVDPAELEGLLVVPTAAAAPREPERFVLAAETPEPEPTPTPIPPLWVFGISSDDGGVSAAAVTPTPPPIRIVNVAGGDDEETPTPDAETAEEPTAEPTPEGAPVPNEPSPEAPETTEPPSPEPSDN